MRRDSMRTKLITILAVASAIAAAASLAAFLGRVHFLLDDLSAFRPQYALVLAACAIALAGLRRPKPALAVVAVALLNLALVAPAYMLSADPPLAFWPPRRLLVYNVHTASSDCQAVVGYILAEDPDYVILQEIDDRWWRELAPLRQRYPFSIAHPLPDNFGIAVLAKQPVGGYVLDDLSPAGRPTVVAMMAIDGRQATIIATHPLPPTGPAYFADRNRQLVALARLAAGFDGAVILAGDLNLAPWSPFYYELLASSGLRDSRNGFGLQATWPSYLRPLATPIDHCLVSKDVLVHDRRVGPALGSDHLPVVVDFSIR